MSRRRNRGSERVWATTAMLVGLTGLALAIADASGQQPAGPYGPPQRLPAVPAVAPQFSGVTTQPMVFSVDLISTDGGSILGEANVPNREYDMEAVRWSNGVLQVIGRLPGDARSRPVWSSADGSVVVGISSSAAGFMEVFRWTANAGIHGLGVLEQDNTSHQPVASGDGEVVFGRSGRATVWWPDIVSQERMFRWSADAGIEELEGPQWLVSAQPRAVCADGSTMIGFFYGTPPGPNHYGSGAVFVWTAGPEGLEVEEGSFEELVLPTFNELSWGPNAISDGGTAVVATAAVAGPGSYLAMWSRRGLTGAWAGERLPTNGRNITPMGVSDDGRVVVGYEWVGTQSRRAVVWTSQSGWMVLSELLSRHGANLNGWSLEIAARVSSDGTSISGTGAGTAGAGTWTVTGLRLIDSP